MDSQQQMIVEKLNGKTAEQYDAAHSEIPAKGRGESNGRYPGAGVNYLTRNCVDSTESSAQIAIRCHLNKSADDKLMEQNKSLSWRQ